MANVPLPGYVAEVSPLYPYLWYSALVLLVAVIPWMRRLWYPIFMGGGILLYHAAISAAALTVQPRYTIVVNPFKGLMVIALVILGCHLIFQIVDSWLVSRRSTTKQ